MGRGKGGGSAIVLPEGNLFLSPSAFEAPPWSVVGLTRTADATADPNGDTTADLIAETTDGGSHQIQQGVSVTSGVQYRFSVYAKAFSSPRRIGLRRATTSGLPVPGSHYFDLETGTISGTSWDGLSISDAGNGWYLCQVLVTATATATAQPNILLIDGAGATAYAGDGTSGAYLWGAYFGEA